MKGNITKRGQPHKSPIEASELADDLDEARRGIHLHDFVGRRRPTVVAPRLRTT